MKKKWTYTIHGIPLETAHTHTQTHFEYSMKFASHTLHSHVVSFFVFDRLYGVACALREKNYRQSFARKIYVNKASQQQRCYSFSYSAVGTWSLFVTRCMNTSRSTNFPLWIHIGQPHIVSVSVSVQVLRK